MSSRKPAETTIAPQATGGSTRRALLGVALASLVVAGCGFQPMYGSGFAGPGGGERMKEVDIGLIPGRVGQVVRNELIFKTRGGAEALPARYRLEIALRESAQNLLVDLSGNSQGLMFGLDAEFKLIAVEDNRVVLSAKSVGRASYQKVQSVYANVRGRRDAEDRAARMIADDIRTRLAAALLSDA
jgi:LPS-assembly lipoprotein